MLKKRKSVKNKVPGKKYLIIKEGKTCVRIPDEM